MTSILSQDEAAKLGLAPKRKRNKYNAKSVVIDCYRFPSQLEARRYGTLKMRERAGEICDLRVHPRFDIALNGRRICVVELDFAYVEQDSLTEHYEDCKGLDNALSKLKRALVEAQYGITVEIIR